MDNKEHKLFAKLFNSAFHTYKVDEILNARLKQEERLILTQIGIPRQILSSKFSMPEQLKFENSSNSLILGEHERVSEWKLKINLDKGFIYLSGIINGMEPVFSFYNSSLKQLLLSLHSHQFFVRRLILQKSFGNYHENYEKYAALLKELILDIDEEAANKGAWAALIDEMSYGAI